MFKWTIATIFSLILTSAVKGEDKKPMSWNFDNQVNWTFDSSKPVNKPKDCAGGDCSVITPKASGVVCTNCTNPNCANGQCRCIGMGDKCPDACTVTSDVKMTNTATSTKIEYKTNTWYVNTKDVSPALIEVLKASVNFPMQASPVVGGGCANGSCRIR